MRTYENKDELKNEINKSFAKYISEFNDIPEHLRPRFPGSAAASCAACAMKTSSIRRAS